MSTTHLGHLNKLSLFAFKWVFGMSDHSEKQRLLSYSAFGYLFFFQCGIRNPLKTDKELKWQCTRSVVGICQQTCSNSQNSDDKLCYAVLPFIL